MARIPQRKNERRINMEAKELMIGDWVEPHQCRIPTLYCKVEGIYPDDTVHLDKAERLFALSELHPIPLTREILEKNGFYWGNTSDEEDFASAVGCGLPEPMWTYDEGDGSVQVLFPNKSDGGLIKLSDQNFDRDMEFVFCKDIYVHELQHLMKIFGIGKEIEI